MASSTAFTDPRLKVAKERGYLQRVTEEAWETFSHTKFIGVWLRKYPNRVKELDILKDIAGHVPTWKDLNDITLKLFQERLSQTQCSSSVNVNCARLKAVINECIDDVAMPTKKYAKILHSKKEQSINVYLNETEVQKLEQVLTKSAREEYVKHTFLISAYTGCRHSDALLLTADNINRNSNTLSYVSQKTKIKAIIPVHRNLVGHIEKLAPLSLKECDEKTYNVILRTLCKRAGINDQVKVFRAGESKSGAKHEFVASHCARRSFATNLAMRSVDVAIISQMMGHSNIMQTMRYICEVPIADEKALAFFG